MIDVSKLTDEKVSKAMGEFLNVSPRIWGNNEDYKVIRKRLRAAASYLQLPIEPPSEQEAEKAYRDCAKSGYSGDSYPSFRYAMQEFVSCRNAANFPKPDPRREIVSKMLRDRSLDCSFDEFAEKIIAALEKVNP